MFRKKPNSNNDVSGNDNFKKKIRNCSQDKVNKNYTCNLI